jgi:hypothetical protein
MLLNTRLGYLGVTDKLALEWFRKYNDSQRQEAWDECPRADWMLWYVVRTVDCPVNTAGRIPIAICLLDLISVYQAKWPGRARKPIRLAIAVARDYISDKRSVSSAQMDRAIAKLYVVSPNMAALLEHVLATGLTDDATSFPIRFSDRNEQALTILREHFPAPPFSVETTVRIRSTKEEMLNYREEHGILC